MRKAPMDASVAALFPVKQFVPWRYTLTKVRLNPLRCQVIGIQFKKLKVLQLSERDATVVACEAQRGLASSR